MEQSDIVHETQNTTPLAQQLQRLVADTACGALGVAHAHARRALARLRKRLPIADERPINIVQEEYLAALIEEHLAANLHAAIAARNAAVTAEEWHETQAAVTAAWTELQRDVDCVVTKTIPLDPPKTPGFRTF